MVTNGTCNKISRMPVSELLSGDVGFHCVFILSMFLSDKDNASVNLLSWGRQYRRAVQML